MATTLQQTFDFLNFLINKKTGAWFTVPELEDILDAGQMSLFEDLKPKYATSQDIKDALAPFRGTYNFTTANTISGYVVVPSNSDYLSLIDVNITFLVSNRTMYYSVPMVNEDELSSRLNSQTNPVTLTSPVGEMTAPRFIRFYPVGTPGYTGTVKYWRRPVKPVFGYSVISGRVIVYNAATSTQLEWPDDWKNAVIAKALLSAGINLSDEEITQFAAQKTQENFVGVNRL